MGRSWFTLLVFGLLGPLAGCQLTVTESITAPLSASRNGPGTPGQPELPAKKSAEVCLVTAEALEKAGKETEADGKAAELAGKEKEAAGKVAAAITHYETASALYEKARQLGAQKQIARRLAVLYGEQKNYPRACEEYKKLLKQSPKDADLLNDAGYCYYNQGNWDEAEKYLKQALAANPKHERAWINLGMTLAQNGRTEESVTAFTKVVRPAQAQCNLAFIWTTQGKFEEAKAAYRQALALEPTLVAARGFLAKLENPGRPSSPVPIPGHVQASEHEEADQGVIDEQAPIEVPQP